MYSFVQTNTLANGGTQSSLAVIYLWEIVMYVVCQLHAAEHLTDTYISLFQLQITDT